MGGNGDGGKARKRLKQSGFVACTACGEKWNFKRNSLCFTCGAVLCPLAGGRAPNQPGGDWGPGGKSAKAAAYAEKLRKESADLKAELALAKTAKPKKEPTTRVEKALGAVQALEAAKDTEAGGDTWKEALATANSELRSAREERDASKKPWHRDSDLEQTLAKKQAHLKTKVDANVAATKNFEEAKA